MPSLFSEHSSLWSTMAILRLLRRAGVATVAPFNVLHRINWSEPWQERRACVRGIEEDR